MSEGRGIIVDDLSYRSCALIHRLIYGAAGSVYPQNHMRNVARKGCPSEYVLLLDVDIVPTQGMAQALARFLRRPDVERCHRCAYVLPTYELDVSAVLPSNKTQLTALEDAGRAQPFHHKAFRYNQLASNLTR